MADVANVPVPPARKAIVSALILTGTMMVVLDTTIANVALPHMQSALGASPESVSWVLTSYILASAISTPITGWLAGRIGRKLLFAVAIAGFTASSAFCGVAVTLPMMVFARVLQGIFGAFIVPMSQSFMYDSNPPSKQVRAMTIWGMGIMVAPIMGPLVGGYLTETINWRWVFFINVPIGIVATIGIMTLLPEFPSTRRPFDRVGFFLLMIGLGGLQLVLDRGTQQDWFSSTEILIEAGLGIAGFWMLFFHLRNAKDPIVPGALFRDRNFVAALFFIFVIGAIVTAGSALLAPMLQNLLGYPVFTAGLLVVPRGVGMMFAMVAAGRLMAIMDTRIVIASGMVMVAYSLWMMTGFDLEMGSGPIIVSGVIQGFGMGLAMMPINLLSVATLPPSLRTEGSAFYSLVRNIGGSVVIALTSALLARNLQINHSELGAAITTIKMPFLMSGMSQAVGVSTSTLLEFINAEINRQAMMIAYLDDYWLMMWSTILLTPLVFVLRPVRPAKGEPIVVGE